MAKTNPIGVRFDLDILAALEKNEGIKSPQKGLNFLSDFYIRNREAGRVLVEVAKDVLDQLDKLPFDQYSHELKMACSWADVDAISIRLLADDSLSLAQKALLKEKVKQAKSDNYC